jgi:hypothetical protein
VETGWWKFQKIPTASIPPGLNLIYLYHQKHTHHAIAMKSFLTSLALLVFLGAHAQTQPADTSKDNCVHWIETFQDKASGRMVTGALSNAVGTTMDGKTDVADIYVMRSPAGTDKDIAITISLLDGGCIPHLGNIDFFFTDETQAQVKHDGKPNCHGFVEIFMGPTYSVNDIPLKLLNNKTIKYVRVGFMNDKWVDMLLTQTEADKIKYAIRCLQK